MGWLKKVIAVVLAGLLLAAIVMGWKYLTEGMTSLVENTWCLSVQKAEVCQFRGYQHFMIWMVIGIVNIVTIGLLFENIGDRVAVSGREDSSST